MSFARHVEPKLRLAVVAAYGPDPGLDGVQEALVWAWQNWGRVETLRNPAGYLYRMAMRRAARLRHRRPVGWLPDSDRIPWIEPGLARALRGMSEKQRQVVVLVAAFEYTQQEVAQLLGIQRSTVQTHLERGMRRLRLSLGVDDDA